MANHAESQPFLTIVTATRNAASTLETCLKSVEALGDRCEHLVIDSCSTDGTLDLVRRHARPGLRWISEPDSGIYDAWNKALRMAEGEWISFLGADDRYLPTALETYRQLAEQHPSARYLSSQVRWLERGRAPRLLGTAWSWPRFQRFMCTAHVGSLHHRSLFAEYGSYDDSLRIVGDYEFLLRPGRKLAAAFTPTVTAEMSAGGTSDSLAALDEAARIRQTTGGRPAWRVAVELRVSRVGFRLRKWFRGPVSTNNPEGVRG